MKILTLNWGCGQTSIGKIISDIELYTKSENVEYFHIYESGKVAIGNSLRLNGWFSTRVYWVISKVTGIRYGIGYVPYLKVKHWIRINRPDIVHIHCPNGHSINIYRVFHYLKKIGLPVVVTNHAEFFYTGNCSHSIECLEYTKGCIKCVDYKKREAGNKVCLSSWAWKKMYQALDNPNIVMVAVSPWVMNKMEQSPIALSANKLLKTIFNGVNTEVFRWLGKPRKDKKMKILSTSGGFSTEVSSIKGGFYLNQLAKRCVNLDVEFLVAGNAVCLEGISDNITFLGQINDQNKLAKYYNDADATIVVSRRETFSMPVAESLCCGTPVIGFKNGGSESIALKEYCTFVEFGDIDALYNEIRQQKFIAYNRNIISTCARKVYGSEQMAEKYLNLYKELLNKD